MANALDKLRSEIDAIDASIVDLLNRRARLALEIGSVKKANKEPLYSPERERHVLGRIKSLNHGPTSHASLDEIYRAVMSSALSLEHTRHFLAGGMSDGEIRNAIHYVAGSTASVSVARDCKHLLAELKEHPESVVIVGSGWAAEWNKLLASQTIDCVWAAFIRMESGSDVHVYDAQPYGASRHRPALALLACQNTHTDIPGVVDMLQSLPVERAELVSGLSQNDPGALLVHFTVPPAELSARYGEAFARAGCSLYFIY